jgi:hypothetical protein
MAGRGEPVQRTSHAAASVRLSERLEKLAATLPLSLVVICAVAVASALLVAPLIVPPAEDAAIVFQFARNLARHGVIAYSLTDGPAEGATDFLWMISIAKLSRLGLPEHFAANLITATAFLVTALLVPYLLGIFGRWTHVLFVGGLALAPMLAAALSGFSNLVFGLFVLLLAIIAPRKHAYLFYSMALACCLFRPDGAVPAVAACAVRWAWLWTSRERARDWYLTEIAPLAIAAILGAGYWLLRWHYFGEFFPLPFYVKTSCASPSGVCYSWLQVRTYLLLSLAAFALWIVLANRRDYWTAASIFLVCSISLLLFYVFVRLDQNNAGRFFYPAYLGILTLLCLSVTALSKRYVAAAVVAVAACLPMDPLHAVWSFVASQRFHSSIPIALELKRISPPGKLGSTEAGILAFLSEWPSVDLWGLNTARYARRIISPEEIQQEQFDVLVVHAGGHYDSYLSIDRYCGKAPRTVRMWHAMVENIYTAMCPLVPMDYELVILPRNPHDASPSQTKRFDAVFLRRNFHRFAEVRDIFVRNGAMSRDIYNALRSSAPR